MAELSDQELLDALGVEAKPQRMAALTPREERIIAGFEEIQRFVEEEGRLPTHGEERDIFERLYAIRLDRIRGQAECRDLVSELDHQNLLGEETAIAYSGNADVDDEELLAELGVDQANNEITELKHVRSSVEKRAAEEIANREPCVDFDTFKPLFDQIQNDLKTGVRESRPFKDDAKISQGDWFILFGQKTYVAEEGEDFTSEYGRKDCRLRVIFDNKTESGMLKRSLERALQKDDTGRRITDPDAGPLFSSETADEDQQSGTIYVLRSKSNLPIVAENRDVIHKIGVTGGDVKKRISNAKNDPTYLLADVEIVATYDLYNINRSKLEQLIHRFFESARLEIDIKDRFGRPISPKEWYMLPLFIIDEVVQKIKNGDIADHIYDVKSAKLIRAAQGHNKGADSA